MVPPRCTLAYAPPEVVAAYHGRTNITVAAAHDVWALGVIAFEAVVGHLAVQSLEQLFQCAQGKVPFPWDVSMLSEAPERWRYSRLRPLIEHCLAHDAAERPTAAEVMQQVERMWLQSSRGR